MHPPIKFQADQLAVRIFSSQPAMAAAAALDVRDYLQDRLHQSGEARVILASANSQIQFLQAVHQLGGVDWGRVTLFHMDEYLGISDRHSASFARFMREQVQEKFHPRAFHFLQGDASLPLSECRRYADLLSAQPIDLCCLGIGENGHLAFNDPPVADFQDPHPVKLVKLDDHCKQQQVDEGHFPALAAVPSFAYTLTIPALCSARKMVCIVPEKRKAAAVRATVEGPVETACPASWLRLQPHATLYLDADSASGLCER